MKQYLDLCKDVLENGIKKEDRTGTGTISSFAKQMRYDLNDGFPMVTTKKLFMRGIIHELLWFIKGDTNIKYLIDNDVHIWDDWAYENYAKVCDELGFPKQSMKDYIQDMKDGKDYDLMKGENATGECKAMPVMASDFLELGPVYGKQWRRWESRYGNVDQLGDIIKMLRTNPDSRRMILCAWNPGEAHLMALPPCHSFIQFYSVDNKLSCHLYQRSGDIFLGIPFNIASYSLLTHMIAQCVGMEVGEFIHTIGDAHIYSNHVDQVNLQLSREPKELPKLVLNPKIKDIDAFTIDDITIEGYKSHPRIKGEVAV